MSFIEIGIDIKLARISAKQIRGISTLQVWNHDVKKV